MPRNHSAEGDEALVNAINEVIVDARLELDRGKFWRVHKDRFTGEWTVRNLATRRHAARDVEPLAASRHSAQIQSRLRAASVSSEYVAELLALLAAREAPA
jgi:hypothetical protein